MRRGGRHHIDAASRQTCHFALLGLGIPPGYFQRRQLHAPGLGRLAGDADQLGRMLEVGQAHVLVTDLDTKVRGRQGRHRDRSQIGDKGGSL